MGSSRFLSAKLLCRLFTCCLFVTTFLGAPKISEAQQVSPVPPAPFWLENNSIGDLSVHWTNLCPTNWLFQPVCLPPYFPGTVFIYRVDMTAPPSSGDWNAWCASIVGNQNNNPPAGISLIWSGAQAYGHQAINDAPVPNRDYTYFARTRNFTGLWESDSICSPAATGRRTCGGGRVQSGSNCVCPGTSSWDGSQCGCPSGQVLTGGTCVGSPVINSHPSNQAGFIGENKTYSCSASAVGSAVTLQWQRKRGSITINISGATGTSYTVSNIDMTANGDQYRCRATNIVNSAYSNYANLTVYDVPQITANPSSVTVNQGSSVTFSCSASHTAPGSIAYQWQRNGNNISGATGSSYTRSNIQMSDNGAGIRCRASNGSGSVYSSVATITVVAATATPTATATRTATPTHTPVPPVPTATATATATPVPAACADGIDNDGDGLIDYPADPGCSAINDGTETNAQGPQCDNGFDDDGDSAVDMADPNCSDPMDNSEGVDEPCVVVDVSNQVAILTLGPGELRDAAMNSLRKLQKSARKAKDKALSKRLARSSNSAQRKMESLIDEASVSLKGIPPIIRFCDDTPTCRTVDNGAALDDYLDTIRKLRAAALRALNRGTRTVTKDVTEARMQNKSLGRGIKKIATEIQKSTAEIPRQSSVCG